MLWQELSWCEIDAIDRNIPVMIPLGACEQHGHHLPTGVDTIQVTALANDVEKQLASHVLLTPVVPIGSSHHHIDFPGTISLRPSVYAQVINDIAQSIIKSGFRRLFFLNGHGGNRVPGSQALSELVALYDSADAATIAFANWWDVAGKSISEIGFAQPVMGHACEMETSLMLELRADLVRPDKRPSRDAVLRNEWFDSESDAGKRVMVFHRFHRFTSEGPLGHPEMASAEKGARLRQKAVAEIVAFLSDFSTWKSLPPVGPK
jgi:creatinine amidohydrolase